MRLRKQLLIVSLVTLVVPWAGCQYVREMDATLRKGQSQALSATGKAIAARLGSDPASVKKMRSFAAPPGTTSLYIHPLNASIITDGYEEEWVAQPFSRQTFRSAENARAQVQVAAGSRREMLFLFIRVSDERFEFFSPAQSSALESDFLEITTLDSNHQQRTFIVYASAPGPARVARVLDDNKTVIEHKIKGSWLDWERGYKAELALPASWANIGLGVRVKGMTIGTEDYEGGNRLGHHAIPPVVSPVTFLSEELQIFHQEGVRVSVASQNARLVAQSGNLKNRRAPQHGLVSWIYDLILDDPVRASLDTPQQTGQFETSEPGFALTGASREGWYLQGANRVLRVAMPIYNLEQVIGAVVLDQNAESLANMTSDAFDQLLLYSVLVSSTAALTFLLYASWLSLRIRKLSQAAAVAVNESGKITENFPVYQSEDEIGDLSRSYAQLLSRLREYTNYLRTLSSKLSHELRTPLAIVKTSLDNLEHETLGEKARIYADRASEGTGRLSSILNAMSAASRVEQTIGAAELEIIPLEELLTHLKSAYADVYKNAVFRLNIPGDGEKLKVLGSSELLVQMLDKLVDNAADFCPAKGCIALGLHQFDDKAVITVQNDGPPLPIDMQSQLFDSMVSVRTEASTSSIHHLGLGLYIVRLIAEFHHGEVHGYNAPDKSGVIFEIRLPLENNMQTP